YQKLGERGTELTGYPCVSIYHGFRYHPRTTLHGGFIDWTYDHLGIFSFSTELWDIAGQAGIKDLHKLTVTVQNAGFLPTSGSKKAIERGVVQPVEVRLELPDGVELLIGKVCTEVGQLEGRSNKLWSSPFIPGYPTDHERTLEWLVRGPAGAA